MERVVQFTGPRHVEIAEYGRESLSTGHLRVRTRYSGISAGTELTAYRGTNPYLTRTWDPEARLLREGAADIEYPVTGCGYSEVVEVVEVSPELDGTPGYPVTGDLIWGIWVHRGTGAQTPASYVMFSRRLPPFEPPRGEAEDREILLAGLTELGEHARREGVTLFLEPLNRYEDHMVNRLDQAADLIRATGLDSVRIGIDSYHMNIEESDPAAAILAHADLVGHAQVSDSNRFQPGAGHLDWRAWLAALHTVGYDGHLALECRLTGDPVEAVRSVPAFLKRSGA
ncbi:TIM barrel protein [Streptomyces griseoincarnatus]